MSSPSRRVPLMAVFHLAACLLASPSCVRAEDTVTIKPSGRLHYDFARFDNDARGSDERDGDDLRAAWLAISGRFHVIDYKLEADFSGHRPVARDAYIARDFGSTTLTVGQFKQFYTLDDRGSSNHIQAVERSWLAQTLAPSYRLGVGVNWYAPKHFRVMLDWTDSRRRDEVSGRTLDRTGVLAGRVQFDF